MEEEELIDGGRKDFTDSASVLTVSEGCDDFEIDFVSWTVTDAG